MQVKVFLCFGCSCKKYIHFWYFGFNYCRKYKSKYKKVKGGSYDKKWTEVHGFTCLLTHKCVVALRTI
jgi:hypothetical protein